LLSIGAYVVFDFVDGRMGHVDGPREMIGSVWRVKTCIHGVEKYPGNGDSSRGGYNLEAYDSIYYYAEVGLEGSKGCVVEGGVHRSQGYGNTWCCR
jgi:hypothetical protein